MKVYLASWYASRAEMARRAEELRSAGIEVTSRWLEEREKTDAQLGDLDKEFLIETARVDVEDILLANVLVLNVPQPHDLGTANISLSTWARGGRHFEAGLQYATMVFFRYLPASIKGPRKLVIIGHAENIFHHLSVSGLQAHGFDLPEILVYPTWDEAKCQLMRMHQDQEA